MAAGIAVTMFDGPVCASQVDIYGIADPTNRLEAIRAKWPRAADRVSHWEKPDYDYACDGIDRFIGYYPISIAHTGGAKEADKFALLCRDIITALPADLRNCAAHVEKVLPST